jgi:hypothetical protein
MYIGVFVWRGIIDTVVTGNNIGELREKLLEHNPNKEDDCKIFDKEGLLVWSFEE